MVKDAYLSFDQSHVRVTHGFVSVDIAKEYADRNSGVPCIMPS